MNIPDAYAYVNTKRMLTPMPAEDFANLGAPLLAYIRPVETPQGHAFGIFTAAGQPIGVAEERETAFAAARQHELSPVNVH